MLGSIFTPPSLQGFLESLRPKFRRGWRIAFWNTFLALAALIIVTVACEVYFQLAVPFVRPSYVKRFVPGVGVLYAPHTMFRNTNGVDYWIESKVNSLGFLEREPLPPERAEESCHITIIGDSFIEANSVLLAEKFPVRLEEFAKIDLPELDVTTSSFGRMDSGQIQQIPFYDHYARKMSPDLLILVFVSNDIYDNSSFLRNLILTWDPDRPPHAFARKSENGEISLYPPDPEFFHHQILPPLKFEIFPNTFFGSWLSPKISMRMMTNKERILKRASILRKRPRYAELTVDWDDKTLSERRLWRNHLEERPLMVIREAFEFMAFGLDQFQERADRDGASLAILATESMSVGMGMKRVREKPERAPINLLREMAAARGIPVIDMYDYMIRQGGRIEDRISGMYFEHDPHWNKTGHRVAAKVVMEYLKENPGICDTREAMETAR